MGIKVVVLVKAAPVLTRERKETMCVAGDCGGSQSFGMGWQFRRGGDPGQQIRGICTRHRGRELA